MNFKMVSGIETHVELATATKVFCGCSTKFGAAPNTLCCPICTGQPGVLPVLNRKALQLCIRAGLALNCKINSRTRFARKNYFYPDLPKAYQISQEALPVCQDGFIRLESGKIIRIERIHLEEDAGKLVHDGDKTFIDYNRCGVPLIEIVTRPDISSTQEAREYIESLQNILRFAGVSDCRMQEGSLRCDVNISVSVDGAEGTRTEIKNLNSLSNAERAMRSEYERQLAILEGGGVVEQATMRFDEKSGRTVAMRTKESARDYRYFTEPDIPDILISESDLQAERAAIPELPAQRRERYVSLGVSGHTAALLTKYRAVCDYFESCLSMGAGAKNTANLIAGTVFSALPAEEDKLAFNIKIPAEEFATVVRYADEGRMSITAAQLAISRMLESGCRASDCISAADLNKISDEQLEKLCRDAIAANPAAAADYRGGKQKAIGAFFGYLKHASGGRADIKQAELIIKRLLSE